MSESGLKKKKGFKTKQNNIGMRIRSWGEKITTILSLFFFLRRTILSLDFKECFSKQKNEKGYAMILMCLVSNYMTWPIKTSSSSDLLRVAQLRLS